VLGDVTNPTMVWFSSGEVTVDQIVMNWRACFAVQAPLL
jgi:hypothetical protein